MAEDKNIKDKKPKADSAGAVAPAKDAKQEGGIKKKIKVKKKRSSWKICRILWRRFKKFIPCRQSNYCKHGARIWSDMRIFSN